MNNAAEGYITVQGKQLYCHQEALYERRPVLVFLHDSLGCVALWRDFPKRLAQAAQCNLLVYDRLGYGKSAPMPTHERRVDYMHDEAAMLDGLLEQLNIADAILFGHSDGGTIALLAAALYPKRIKAVICEAAHIFVEEVTLQGIRAAMQEYATTNLAERLRKYHGGNTETLFRAWTETWTRPDFRSWSIGHLLKDIICPLLFIQGEADEYGTPEQVRRTVAQVSGPARSLLLPGVGHTPHKEAPEEVLEGAGEFILNLNYKF